MEEKIEIIVVFKKNTSDAKAVSVLGKTGVLYREGMDSSKGKIYFYNTGPKFILTFESEEQRKTFISDFTGHKDIYEIYFPDWDILKD